MDRDEAAYYAAAEAQGLSISKGDDGTWIVTAAPDAALSGDPIETWLAGGLVRLADGRVYKRSMTEEELREALGIVGPTDPS
jgi:hypothetical protein